jgi:hypothetical protein
VVAGADDDCAAISSYAMYTCNSTGAVFSTFYSDSACAGEVISVENVGQADTCYEGSPDTGSSPGEFFKISCAGDGLTLMQNFYAGEWVGEGEVVCSGEVLMSRPVPTCDPQCDDDSSDEHHGNDDHHVDQTGGHSDVDVDDGE